MPTYRDTFAAAQAALHGGDPARCESLIAEFLACQGDAEPGDIPARAMLLDMLARAQFAQKKAEDGLANLQKALNLLKPDANGAAAGKVRPLLIALRQNLSFALLELRRFDEAEEAGREAVACAEELEGAASPQLASALFGFSAVKYRQGKHDEAEELTNKALDIWQALGDKNKIAACFNNLGRIYEERGELDAGIAWHEKAAALRRELPDKLDLAFSLGNLGVALAGAARWRQAVEKLEEAVALYRQAGQGDCPECRGFARNLTICARALNGQDE